MTEYHTYADGNVIADAAVTNGIVSKSFFEGVEGPQWKTGVNPQILREVADLIEFCYPEETGALDVGLAPPARADDDAPPALVVGRADDDRWIMVAPRNDCRAGPKDDTEQAELPE